MAQINWHTRDLSGNRVRLTGKVRLSCGHDISYGAQVRSTELSVEQGKKTITSLLNTMTSNHAKECGK